MVIFLRTTTAKFFFFFPFFFSLSIFLATLHIYYNSIKFGIQSVFQDQNFISVVHWVIHSLNKHLFSTKYISIWDRNVVCSHVSYIIKGNVKNNNVGVCMFIKCLYNILYKMLWTEYLCPPQNSYVEFLTPSVIAFGDVAFGR